MKRYALPTILASTLLAQAASAQSSSTPIIGYYKANVPAGQSIWGSGFVTKKNFQGAATSVSAGAALDGQPTTNITVTGQTFTGFTLHYVELLAPAAVDGRILDIVSTSGDTIRVKGTVTGTPTFCVRAHTTIGTLFAGGAGIGPFDDSITVFNDDGTSDIAQFDGATWDNPNVIIYPGTGFLISALEPRVLTFGGNDVSYIKTNQTRVNIYATAEFNLIAPINPLVSTDPNDPIYNTLARKTPTEFGLAALLAPFDDNAFRLDQVGGFEAVAVYQYDGAVVSETSGGPNVVPDYFRVGSAAIIVPLESSERILQPTFTTN